MAYKSKNMNYIFNVEYFEGIFDIEDSKVEDEIKNRNGEIRSFLFSEQNFPLNTCKEEIEGFSQFSLYTLYPGLLIGIGNPHALRDREKGAIKCGFTFDYVTGLPYITGSTLKGMIRSCFPGDGKGEEKDKDKEYISLIRGILGKDNLNVLTLKKNMFENSDVFLGAFPVVKENSTLMEMEYITSHLKKFKNPNPVSIIKVKPAVEFEFSFLFSDYVENEAVVVSAEEKSRLCKELILLMGIGAKTNVGFGRFSEEKPIQNVLVERQNRDHITNGRNTQTEDRPVCANANCNNLVDFNKKNNKYYKLCKMCFKKQNNKQGKTGKQWND